MIDWSKLTGPVTPAPSTTTLPPVETIAAGLTQTEWLQHSDLAELAGKLVKRKSPEHQMLGRTLSRMLRGEAYAKSGSRNQTLYKVAAEILEAFPYCDPRSVSDLLQISIQRQADDEGSTASNPAPTLREFESMLVRHQGPKQGKHATISEAMAAMAAYRSDAGTGQTTVPLPAVDVAESWGQQPEPTGPTPAEVAGLDRRSLIVRVSDTLYYMRHPAAATYDLKVSSGQGLRIELRRRFVDAGLPLELVDDKNEMLPNDVILQSFSMNAHAVVHDYSQPSTTFDQNAALLRIGISMGRLADLRVIEPEHSDAVELWLYTLCGGNTDALVSLYDWIAGTDQRYINHAAVAVVLQGAPSIGKTQLARGLAMTWGQSEPVPMAIALDRFNGALRSCPIWFADEQMPKDLDQATFRKLIQDAERQIEPKGQERFLLLGCSRLLLAVNDLRDVHISANGASEDAIRATAARLAIYEALPEQQCVAALLAIAQGNQLAERLIIARHLRYIQQTETPRNQRFYGARQDTIARAQQHLWDSAFQHVPSAARALVEYLEDPITWEKQYNENAPAELGLRYPIFVHEDYHGIKSLRINVPEFATHAGYKQQDIWQVRAALQPFLSQYPQRLSIGSRDNRHRGLYAKVNVESITKALSIDVTAAMMTSTRERRAAVGLKDE